jgi:phosphopantothenoylcysteine decarboxylase/phosphopantothenate--cysteine ligase
LCAAVADFRPISIAENKIKREKDNLNIQLCPTNDIAAELGRIKTDEQILVGFALETNNEEINAKSKLERKNLDFIVLNSTRNEGTTFRSNDNQIEIITKNEIKTFEKKNKKYVAADIIDELTKLFTEKNRS